MLHHQIVPGAADKSYGIHVAQLAGVPRSVNERAREVLQLLESQHRSNDSASSSLASAATPNPTRKTSPEKFPSNNRAISSRGPHWQLALFGIEEHPLLDEIR